MATFMTEDFLLKRNDIARTLYRQIRRAHADL